MARRPPTLSNPRKRSAGPSPYPKVECYSRCKPDGAPSALAPKCSTRFYDWARQSGQPSMPRDGSRTGAEVQEPVPLKPFRARGQEPVAKRPLGSRGAGHRRGYEGVGR